VTREKKLWRQGSSLHSSPPPTHDFQISFVPTIRKRKSFTPISYLGRISVAIRSWMKDGRRLTKTGAIMTALWLPCLVKSKQHWTKLSCRSEFMHRSWSLVRYGLLNSPPKLPAMESAANNSGYNGSAALCLRLWKYGNFGASDVVASKLGSVWNRIHEVGSKIQAAVENQLALLSVHLHSVVMRPPRFKPPWHCPIHRYQQQTCWVFGSYGWSERSD